MNSKLIDFQTYLNDNLVALKKLLASCVDSQEVNNSLEAIKNLYEEKIENVEPQIMVYGLYNAGKSSIINELLKNDEAKVDDVPTTDKITKYKWHGYEVTDTPGVGAPIEHEKITNTHLRKADVVLFVMSTTGSNEIAENYTRMKDIIDAGKKVIIVLNDKNGDLGRNDEAIQVVKRKVYENMKATGIADVDNKFCIVVVNSKRARKGRIENKLGMWDKSNMEELEDVILAELKNTNSFIVMSNAVFEIEKHVEAIKKVFASSSGNGDLDKLNRILADLRERKLAIRQDLNELVTRRTGALAKNLPSLIWNNRTNEAEVNAIVQREVDNVVNSVRQEFEMHMQDLQGCLEDGIVELQEYLVSNQNENPLKVNVVALDVNGILSKIKEENAVALQNDSGNFYSQKNSKNEVSTLNPVACQMAANGLGKILGGGMLAKAIPYVGVIIAGIQILSSLFGGNDGRDREEEYARQANNQERQRVAAENQARQELQQKCLYMAEGWSSEINQSLNRMLNTIIGNIEAVLKEHVKAGNEKQKENERILSGLEDITSKYSMIYSKLRNV